MNSVALAIERAVATVRDRAQLPAAFDREWSRVEFADDAESVVVGVRILEARQWWRGELSDIELALAAVEPPEAIFWMGLPRHDEYRAGLDAVRSLHARGARLLVFHTVNRVLIAHALRFGFDLCRRREHGFLLGEAAALGRWLRA